MSPTTGGSCVIVYSFWMTSCLLYENCGLVVYSRDFNVDNEWSYIDGSVYIVDVGDNKILAWLLCLVIK